MPASIGARRLPLFVKANLPRLDVFDNVYAVYATARLVPGYTGPLFQVRRANNGVLLDVSAGPNGLVNRDQITAHIVASSGQYSILYDQMDNARDLTTGTASTMPTVDISNKIPLINFASASSQRFNMPAGGLAFAQNQAAVSVACVAKQTTLTTTQNLIGISSGTAFEARAVMQSSATLFTAGGRRVDGGSFAGTAGFTSDTNWHARIARYEYSAAKLHHRVDDLAETLDPFQTAGSSANTASNTFQIGAFAGASFFNGSMTCIILFRDLLTANEDAQLKVMLQSMKPL